MKLSTTDASGPVIQFPADLPKKTKRNPQITWTSSEPANFECAMDKLNIKIQCGRGTVGEWSEMNVPKGPHTFFVRGTDNVNNVGEWKSYTFDVGEGKIITFCTIIITLSFEGAPGCRGGGGGWMVGGGVWCV